MQKLNEFDELIAGMPVGDDRMACIRACDSAYAAMVWFRTYRPDEPATNSDIIALARMIENQFMWMTD